MILSAATKKFAEELLSASDSGGGYMILCAGTYFLTSQEMSELLGSYFGDANQVLPALISDKVLNTKSEKSISGILRNHSLADNQTWLRLALDCDHKICHTSDLSSNDRNVGRQNSITMLDGTSAAARMIISELLGDRVLRSWTIREGGSISPCDVFSSCARSSQTIQVYDRYITSAALHALKEVLNDVSRFVGGKLDRKLRIYREDSKLASRNKRHATDVDIRNELEPLFVDRSRVEIWNIQGPGRGATYLHDRYVQFDENYTFILPAGLQTFCSHAGVLANKASVIFQMHVAVDYSIFEFDALDETKTNKKVQLRV